MAENLTPKFCQEGIPNYCLKAQQEQQITTRRMKTEFEGHMLDMLD